MDALGKIFHVNFLGYAHWFIPIRIYRINDHYIYMDQDRYATSIVTKYLDTSTVKTSTIFYKNTFPYDMIFAKADASTSYEQVEKLTREFNIHHRACIVSLIHLLSTRLYLIFAVHKLAKFSSNPGKVHFEALVHILRYIMYNKNLGFKYYDDMNYAHLSDLFRQASINTENQLMDFSDYSWQDFPDTGRSSGVYSIFDHSVPIDHGTHVQVPVSQSSAES